MSDPEKAVDRLFESDGTLVPRPAPLVDPRTAAHDQVLAYELRPPGGGRGMVLDSERREVRIVGEVIQLPFVEFSILRVMAAQPYWPFTRRELVAALASEQCAVREDVLDDHVASLRDRLGTFSDYVQTVPGFGYRFRE